MDKNTRGYKLLSLAGSNSSEKRNVSPVIPVQPSIVFHRNNSLIDDDELIPPSENSFYDSDADPLYVPSSDEQDHTISSSEPLREESRMTLNTTTVNYQDEEKTVSSSEVFNKREERSSQAVIKKRKTDFCYFCETDVLNFGRHIVRNHSLEIDVQRIISEPPKSSKRKKLIALLRKKGNYIKNFDTCVKPVRQSYIPNQKFLPCDNCLGFYSAKLLYRHRKICSETPKRGSAQAAGQTQLLSFLNIDKRLKEEVFPRMRADKVSLEAKKDTLICAFGARYLRTHREKHFINVTSRKMRELAKILIEVKKKEAAIKNLFDALQPQHFDLLVVATKIVSNYNPDEDIYETPTFAMNIATSLKQCCDIAITFVLKKKQKFGSISAAETEANLKTMIHLLTTNWRFEVSSQAGNDLNIKKWNKVTIIPLANDLKLLKEYLMKSANNALEKLEINNDPEAYNTLVETIYCRVILFNRKRPGELQRMLVSTYTNSKKENQSYEEFSQTISATEKVMLDKLKRIVIKGKRGRGVPVLFSSDIQNHIKKLLEVRSNFVPDENKYIFGKAHLNSHIVGYKVLDKYVKACGAKNPAAITCTRLRKHLATLTQLFNMSDSEIEQLATFMGHTPGVHRNSYRLPDDVYQTAKISKLLVLMEKGAASEFKGKSLDEIDVDLEENLIEENTDTNESDNELNSDGLIDIISENCQLDTKIMQNSTIPTETKTKKNLRNLVPWTNEQKLCVKQFFQNHIKKKIPPRKAECEQLIKENSIILNNKSWLKIKVFVQNEYSKKK